MAINHGLLSIEDRAQEVARMQKEKMNKTALRKKYKCSFKVIDRVYELRGWKVDKGELNRITAENLKKARSPEYLPGSKWLRIPWR